GRWGVRAAGGRSGGDCPPTRLAWLRKSFPRKSTSPRKRGEVKSARPHAQFLRSRRCSAPPAMRSIAAQERGRTSMASDRRVEELRQRTNPVFNDRALKLGTFGTNLDRGCAISTIDRVLEISWPNTLELAKISEEMEFEALVPIGRWRGFGGTTNFNGPGFECFSWAAGIGASTKYSGIFATSHVPTIHPIMAAKQAACIDHITGG